MTMAKRYFAGGIILTVVVLAVLYLSNLARPLPMPTMKLSEVSVARDGTAGAVNARTDGSFIQWWLVKDWDDTRWLKEYQVLKEAGMNYIVLAPTALYTTGKKTKTIYPTKLDWCETMMEDSGSEYPDVVDACLRNAQKAGIKVFLGLNFSDEWWSKRRDAEWIYARMREGNGIADELWDRYRSKYPQAFYGWYWCWEVDNAYFKRFDFYNSMNILTNAIKIQIDHLDAKNRHLPFMLAPYMDWKLGTPKDYAQMWKYVFANSGISGGDIFCPQDCIGAGGLRMDNYVKWFAELRKAVDTKPGLEMWVDTETFDSTDWTGVTIDRFVKQMKELQPYVDNFISFAYSHYYSPNIVDSDFHKTYMQYVNTGELETILPSTPLDLKAKILADGTVDLSWSESTDNMGVCGYYVYCNGKRIANRQVQRHTESSPEAVNHMVDTIQKSDIAYIYEIQAYDFAGNTSVMSESVTIPAIY